MFKTTVSLFFGCCQFLVSHAQLRKLLHAITLLCAPPLLVRKINQPSITSFGFIGQRRSARRGSVTTLILDSVLLIWGFCVTFTGQVARVFVKDASERETVRQTERERERGRGR